MRIDSPRGREAVLTGSFSGSFYGDLEGTASYAIRTETASYADVAEAAYDLTGSVVSTVAFKRIIIYNYPDVGTGSLKPMWFDKALWLDPLIWFE